MRQQIRATIAGTISDFHMPRFEDIPGVGLYLEQTVSYISDYLSPILDDAITRSMVSNYVKKKLVSNPVHKQYSREQIASLFFIAVTKSVLSLENIRVLLDIQAERYESSAAYNFFCDELEKIIGSVFGCSGHPEKDLAPDLTQACTQEQEEKDILRNTVIAVAHKIYLDKWICQYAK